MSRLSRYANKRFGAFKCDEVQCPLPGPFSHRDLKWHSNEAWIPKSRLPDFLKGEETRVECQTCFKIQETVTRNAARGWITVRYHCSYGPLDARGDVDPLAPNKRILDDGTVPLRQTTKQGTSFRRGCKFHFSVNYRLLERPDSVLLKMPGFDHVDLAGKACHGIYDYTAFICMAHVAPRISIECRQKIERLLRTGVSPVLISLQHRKDLKEKYRPTVFTGTEKVHMTRDMLLDLDDIQNVKYAMDKRLCMKTTDDASGLKAWVESNEAEVLLYQPPKKDEDIPFLLAFATPWMIQKMATLAHGNAVCMDATFGTNQYEYSLYTMLTYDEHQNGIPTCWFLGQRHDAEQVSKVLFELKKRMESCREIELGLPREWQPSCFIIDCDLAEQIALHVVWPDIPIALCAWHVRRAWVKNILLKIRCPHDRAQVNKDLGDMMYSREDDAVRLSCAFMAKWRDTQAAYVEYYENEWHAKVCRWVLNFRKYPHANQNTSGAVERWHHTLKMHLRMHKVYKKGRKVTWLVEQLVVHLEHFYWCMSCLKYQGRVRNRKIEDIVLKAIHKARDIPDADVRFEEGDSVAFVRSQKRGKENHWHVLEGYRGDSCVCTCGSSTQGNTCKHQIKLLLLCGFTEKVLLTSMGTKWGSMMGGLPWESAEWSGENPEPIESVFQGVSFYNTTSGGHEVSICAVTSEAGETVREPEFVNREDLEAMDDLHAGDHSQATRSSSQKRKFTRAHFLKVFETLDSKVGHNEELLMMATLDLLKTTDKVSNKEAQQLALADEGGQEPLIEQFEKVPGSNNSLQPRLSVVDVIHSQRRRKRKGKPQVEKEVDKENVEPFEVNPVLKESMQAVLDRQSREALELNNTPALVKPTEMSKRGRGGKKTLADLNKVPRVRSKARVAARGRGGRSHGSQSQISAGRTVLEPIGQHGEDGNFVEEYWNSQCEEVIGIAE